MGRGRGRTARLRELVAGRVRVLGWVLLPVLALVLGLGTGRAAAAGWITPLPGRLLVSHGFDPPASAYGAGHRGVDLRGAGGELVRAAGAGRISYAGLLAGREVVVVQHDGGLRTTYEPVSPTVRVGQAVATGARLGALATGHAGCPGTCLHWGLLRGQTYLDPLSLLGRPGVRLLPSDGVTPPATGRSGPGSVARHIRPPVPAEPVGRVRPAGAQPFTLRSADRPWGLLALLALVVGLVLLVLPPPTRGQAALRRPGPRPPSRPSTPDTPVPRLRPGASGEDPVDLGRERARRRAS